jgi:hypothetical protein
VTETNELLFAGGTNALVIGEWIPFGANYIDLFSRKIRPSYAPVGSTFLTEEIDTRPGEPTFEIQAPPTELVIRETVRGRRVSLSARLGYLETGGQIQDERVGVQLDVFGRVFFAAGLQSVKGRRGRISLDDLSPIIADLVTDSSKMMATVLASSQNRLLELIHQGYADERDKFVAFLTQGLHRGDGPALGADHNPMDSAGERAEIAQILGEIFESYRLADGTLVIRGRSGLFVVSTAWETYERAVTTYGYIHALEDAVDNLFRGAAINDDRIRRAKRSITSGEVTEASALRKEMTRLSEDITTYKVLSEMLENAVGSLAESVERHADAIEPHERELLGALGINNDLDILANKVGDLSTTFEAVELSMESLVNLVGTLREEETERLNNVMQFLTVVTTVAVPISIITGWYGMNFKVMPELNWPGSYFVVIGVAVLIIVGLLALFKRKKWF